MCLSHSILLVYTMLLSPFFVSYDSDVLGTKTLPFLLSEFSKPSNWILEYRWAQVRFAEQHGIVCHDWFLDLGLRRIKEGHGASSPMGRRGCRGRGRELPRSPRTGNKTRMREE